jgi:hypothetical protein
MQAVTVTVLPLLREDGTSVVGVAVLQHRHPISKAAWDIGARDSEKGSKTSHRASRGKAMHRTLGVRREFHYLIITLTGNNNC